MQSSRRIFLAGTALAGASVAVPATRAGSDNCTAPLPGLIHNVYFWLKDRESEAERDMLIEGLKTLASIPAVKKLYIGVPASTAERDVIDNTYQVSEMLLFDSVADQNAYQEHPIHKQFVDRFSHLWEKVVVYDSIAV